MFLVVHAANLHRTISRVNINPLFFHKNLKPPDSICIRQRVAQIIVDLAERGCPSRSTFDNPKIHGISRAHLAILAAAGDRHPRSNPFGQCARDRRLPRTF